MKILNSLTYWNNNLKIDQIFPWKNQNGESTCRKTNSWCTSNTFKRVQSILRPFFRISICVALALVHFSTLLSLCYYYFFFFFLPIYFYYNYFVICYFTSRAIYRIRRKIRSFLEIAKSRSRMTRAMKRQTFLSFFFFFWRGNCSQLSRLISLISSFPSRSLQSLNLSREWSLCSFAGVKYTICSSNCNDLALPSGLWAWHTYIYLNLIDRLS